MFQADCAMLVVDCEEPQTCAAAALILANAQGVNTSYWSIGEIYLRGSGVEQDYSKALEWFKLGTDQKDSNSYYSLGTIYHKGLGVEQDFGEAR